MKYLVTLSLLLLLIISCSQKLKAFKVAQEPTDKIINQLGDQDYSIVLNDMDIENKEINKEKRIVYKHKYHILKLKNDSLIVDSLDWQPVNENFFLKYEKDLGMEIISHRNGRLSRVSQPVGHGWAIGNPKYGEWVSDTDSTSTNKTDTHRRRHWRPHSSGLFWYWMLSRRTYRSDYDRGRAVRASGKPYYGSNSKGDTKYGTNSRYQKTKRKAFFSRKRSSNTWKNYNKKVSRSSSRYRKSSSTRGRSGGFGK